jgi:O-antigen/teichoic acid export membrane protein
MFARGGAQLRQAVGHRAFVALMDQGAVSGANFATGILLSRAFVGERREQLGLYYLAFTIGILITELQNALVSTPHMVAAPKLRNQQLQSFNGSALIHHFVLSALITMVLFAIALASPLVGLATHEPMLLACATTAGAVGLRNFFRILNFALHRPIVSCAADWLVAVIQIPGIMFLAMTDHLSAGTAVGVIGVASLIGGLFGMVVSLRELRPNLPSAWEDFRENWRLSRWVCASGIVWNIGTSLFPWIIDTFSGTLQAAVWGNCNTVSSLGNPLLMGLQNWCAPAIAHAHTDRDNSRFRLYVIRMAALFAMMLPPMLVVLGFLSNPLLHRVYKDPTANTLILVLLLAAAWVVQSMSFAISRGLFSLGRGDLDLWANTVPVVVLLGAGYSLIHQGGAAGGAVCLLSAQVLALAVRGGLFWFATAAKTSAAVAVADEELIDGIVSVEAM